MYKKNTHRPITSKVKRLCTQIAGYMTVTAITFMVALSTHAATATDPFNVTALVGAVCTIQANDLEFGNYNPLSANNHAGNTTIQVTCSTGVNFNVGIDAGEGADATTTNRKMTRTVGGTETLTYQLFQDNNHTINWGNTVGTNTVSGTTTASIPLYGLILAGQNVPNANYADMLVATVTY